MSDQIRGSEDRNGGGSAGGSHQEKLFFNLWHLDRRSELVMKSFKKTENKLKIVREKKKKKRSCSWGNSTVHLKIQRRSRGVREWTKMGHLVC